MDDATARNFISNLYRGVLGRDPNPVEFGNWVSAMNSGETPESVLDRFVNSKERLEQLRVKPGHVVGSYYSPIVDPTTVVDYLDRVSLGQEAMEARGFPGIEIDESAMVAFWTRHSEWIRKTPFGNTANSEHRYHYQTMYPPGDAVVLRAMIGAYKPQKIVEIGSGFSSACILDSAEEAGISNFQLTCIEPYPERLLNLLRPEDDMKLKLITSDVQKVPLETFQALKANDILLIDSTHVLKTGSDVHFELFNILPSLAPGVLVHFHDIHFPFEYPKDWVLNQRYSWNEAYAVRAFLMYNRCYEILFFTHLFGKRYPDLIHATCPDMLQNIGGSLWIRKIFAG